LCIYFVQNFDAKKTDLNDLVMVSPAGDVRPQEAIEALEVRNAEDETEANGEDLEDAASEAVEVRAVADEAEEKMDDDEDSEVRKWIKHKVLKYVEHRAVSGVFQNIDPHPPLPLASVYSTRTKGGGVHSTLHTRRAVGGGGGNILEYASHRIGFFQYNLSSGSSISEGRPGLFLRQRIWLNTPFASIGRQSFATTQREE
jgi:hypothetical protein